MRKKIRGRNIGRLPRIAILTASLALASCTPAAMPDYQMQRYPYLNEKTLVLKNKKTKTTESYFIDMLKKTGATNIISSKGYLNGHTVSAVTADYMDYIYLFDNGTYIARLEIKYDEGKPQVHPFAKVVHGNGYFGVLLVAENIEHEGKRVAQLILIKKGGKAEHIDISLEKLIEKHGGIYDPYVGGENLKTGVFLAGRMNTGEPWFSVYKITLEKGKIVKKKVPAYEAAGCSCYDSWMEGKDAREVFDMKVE